MLPSLGDEFADFGKRRAFFVELAILNKYHLFHNWTELLLTLADERQLPDLQQLP